MSSSSKKRTDILVWVALSCLFAYVWINKYGVLLAYLKIAGVITLVLTGFLTYLVMGRVEKINSVLYAKNTKIAGWLDFFKPAIFLGFFVSISYVGLIVQPDKILIAHYKGIPIEALYPCSNQPLDDEVEKIAREIYRVKEHDTFECD